MRNVGATANKDATRMDNQGRRRANNTSGYTGVSWHKDARKWTARIRGRDTYHYLGMFSTPEAAHEAYKAAALRMRGPAKVADPNATRLELIATVRGLYETHGIQALSTPFLERQKSKLYHRLLGSGLKQTVLLDELGLTAEYKAWRDATRKYRGETKPKWTWEIAVETAQTIKQREGDLPTLEWCRVNGYSSVVNTVFRSGHTWEELREAVGCFATSPFVESRSGIRWRSRPEASLSNFLYARGIEHKRGGRYAEGYAAQSGRRYGSLDLSFRATDGQWIDVEVWGENLERLTSGRYAKTRRLKERWQSDNPRFLGIGSTDCLSDHKLTQILEPFIGIIEPFRFDRPTDKHIETSHWTDADDLLEHCKTFAEQMPDGIFPSDEWLRKRGRYATRPGPAYNTLSVRVNQWLGGTRKVRALLGQGDVGTIQWTPARALAAWRAFHKRYGVTPSQCQTPKWRNALGREVLAEGSKIYHAAKRHGVLQAARGPRRR